MDFVTINCRTGYRKAALTIHGCKQPIDGYCRNPAKAGNDVRAAALHPVKREIGETGIG